MKRNRTALLQIYLYPHERQQLREIAQLEGIGVSTWARSHILAAVRRVRREASLELVELERPHKQRRAGDVER